MENLRFSPACNRFYAGLHKEVYAYLRQQPAGAYAGRAYWIKAFFLLFSVLGAYAWLLHARSAPAVFAAYLLLGFSLLLLALNVAHDASHGSISRSKKLNRFLYHMGFALQGANGYFWQKRHLHEHHPYPNVPDRDPDLLNVKWLRYASSQPFRPYHAWQCRYALLLYAVYTLYWIFVKDFSRSGTPVSRPVFMRLLLVNLVHKTLYLLVFVWLPVQAHPQGAGIVLAGFFVMHVVVSLFLVFTFAMSHYISGQPETQVHNGQVAGSWAEHQVESSVDFHVNSRLALFVFGGFNCHVAHHLFPSVSHVHYPAISRMVYRHLEAAGLKAREITFVQGVRLHFRLLREMSVKPQ